MNKLHPRNFRLNIPNISSDKLLLPQIAICIEEEIRETRTDVSHVLKKNQNTDDGALF